MTKIGDPRIIANTFRPDQLTRARELRLLTKADLAGMIGKSAASIGQFENGLTRPDMQTVARLSLALGFPPDFFARPQITRNLQLEECHFRSLRSASIYLRRQAMRTGEILHELFHILETEGVKFPTEDITSHREHVARLDAEAAAAEVRSRWGLSKGPIHEPVKLAESRGVRIIPLPGAFEKVDAFSFWHNGVPFIMLDMSRPPSRIHFDVAHELGHLFLHEDVAPGDPNTEADADHFASAFLLPRATFGHECPTRWRLEDFVALKSRWRVSVAALVYRAHSLGRLTSASHRRAYQMLNAKGIRRNEPGEWVLCRPSVLASALALVAADLPMRALAARLAIYEQHLLELLSETFL